MRCLKNVISMKRAAMIIMSKMTERSTLIWLIHVIYTYVHINYVYTHTHTPHTHIYIYIGIYIQCVWLDGYMLYVPGTSYKENKKGQLSEKRIQTSELGWKNQGRTTFEICCSFHLLLKA